MIKDNGGRLRSEQTPEEIAELLRKEMAQLTAEEREALILCLRELDDPAVRTMQQSAAGGGPVRILDALSEGEYIRPVVDVRTFIRDPYFLGATCDGLYPRLLDDMVELFDGGYKEAVLTGSIGWGKCVDLRTEVFDVSAGMRRAAGDLGEFEVVSMADGGKIESRPAKSFLSGRKACVRLTLAAGQSIVLSNDHPVFTSRGWVEAGNVAVDDLVATPRVLPEPKTICGVSEDEVKLIAYLLSDGGCTASITFTNETDEIVREFTDIVQRIGKQSRGQSPDVTPAARQNAGKATTFNVRGVMDIVRGHGIHEHSRNKRVPAKFYGLSKEHVAVFLNRFWACDGSVSHKAPQKAEVTLASEKMVDDIAFLLLRLGVHARKLPKEKSYRTANGKKKSFQAWCLTVTGADNLMRFLEKVGPILGKEKECAALSDACSRIKSNTNTDVVPVGLSELREIREELRPRGNGLTRRFGFPEGQLLGRDRFKRLCEEERYDGKHAWLAKSDLLWEKVKLVEDAGERDVVDLSVDETHSFVGNGIVVHNTFFASIAVCRCLYEISCLRDPHRSFGLAKDTNISFVALSISEALAIKVVFENIASKLKASPYFQEHFPFEETKKELRFPHKVWVAARSSTDTSALGLNVFGAILDEGNFFEPIKGSAANQAKWGNKDKAQVLYEQLVRRMKSRFQRHGKLPGLMIVVSSKRTRDDFTAKRVREASADAEVFVRDYAVYDVKPEAFSKERFHVLVGNETTVSKILAPEEVDLTRRKIEESGAEGLLVIDVPDDFRADFEADLEGAIRDIAGVETVSVSPFLQQRDRIAACIDKTRSHPFSSTTWDQSKPGDFVWTRFAKRTMMRDGAEVFEGWQPIFYPGVTRHAHIDPSLNSDATGVAIGCVIGYKNVERRNYETNEVYTEPAPVIWVDLVLRVSPPLGGEIDHGKIRGLIYQMQSHGFPVGLVTMDQFNCLARGTPVHTARGILPIEEVVVGDIVQSRIGPKPVEKVWAYPKTNTLRITTQDGDVLEGTGKHMVEVQAGWTSEHESEYGWTRDPVWEWRRLDQISVGDVVHMIEKPVDFDSTDVELNGTKDDFGWTDDNRKGLIRDWQLPSRISPDFAELLGLIWGDGDVGDRHIRLTCHVDDLSDAERSFVRVFGISPSPVVSDCTDKAVYLRLHSSWLVRWMDANGLKKPTIPSVIMRGSRAVKSAFLRGLFSADGSVSNIDGEVYLATSILELAQQVRLLLRVDFGIESCLVTADVKYESQKRMPGWQGGYHYHVSVRGPRARFLERIGFCYRSKQQLLEKHARVKGRRKFVKIIDIEQGEAEVFDIQVADDPSYVANGFVSHNSAASLQKFAVKGIEAERISVDRPPDAYDTLKSAIYEGRVLMYEYEPLLEELRTLQRDKTKNKIDHPRGGSKDVADALAGIVFTLTTRYRGTPLGIFRGISQHGADPALEEQQRAVEPDDFFMPFLQG